MPVSNVGTFNILQPGEPDQITSYMKQTPSWKKADSELTGQEIIHLSWIPKFHYHISIHKTLPVHILTFYLFKIHRKDTLLSTGVQSGLFRSGFLTKILFAFHTFSQYCYHARCDHINILQRQLILKPVLISR